MRASSLRPISYLLPLVLAATAAGCASDPVTGDEEDLTSVTARSRALQFDGYVYVSATASDAEILAAVRAQTKSMFGSLRTAEIGVNNRELKIADASSFKKTPVTVVDTKSPTAPTKSMLKVTYRYTDDALVPVAMAKRTAITLAVMAPSYQAQSSRILKECTENDAEAKEFTDSLWYVLDASLSQCQAAIAKEAQAIDAENQKLTDVTKQVSRAEAERLYLPTTVALGADKTNKKKSYPEYDRLYTGGVEPGKVVIGLVNGFLDHEHPNGEIEDSAYPEWLDEMRQTMTSGPTYKVTKVEPAADLSTFTAGTKTVKDATIYDILAWGLDGKLPTGFTSADRKALKAAVGDKLIRHWVTLEAPIKVKIGTAATKDVTLKIQTYFGAESDSAPHKRGIKTSDVFIYNGHSYIGYGPLDPSRFSASDFPASYQILFIDGCVSYNYYEKDYFPLKTGGTENLELITNGLEAPAWHSGYALGRFLNLLLNGKQASYKDLLTSASETDPLRVVDGEVDNVYSPTKKKITVTF
jgi:hypothetical protein